MMLWMILPVSALFAAYFLFTVRHVGAFTADTIFVYSQMVMFVGTVALLQYANLADRVHGYIVFYCLVAYMVTSMVVLFLHSKGFALGIARAGEVPLVKIRRSIVLCLLISLIVVSVYYFVVGYNFLLLSVASIFVPTDLDAATLRLGAYSGNKYFFPGYVNQFKNILLPCLSALVVTGWLLGRRKGAAVSIFLVICSVVGLLGTGQRSGFILFAATILVYLYWLDTAAFKSRARKLLLPFVGILALATVALGRSADGLAAATGLFAKGSIVLSELQRRFLFSNQLSSVAGFRYVYPLPSQGGQEWVKTFAGILPGNSGSDLSNQVFASLYGGSRGTSPVSIWGSVYYNFGLLGIALAPIFLAVILQILSFNMLRVRSRNNFQVIGMAGIFVSLGTWIAGSPVAPINNGLVLYALLWFWGRRIGVSEDVIDSDRVAAPVMAVSGAHQGWSPSEGRAIAGPVTSQSAVRIVKDVRRL